MIKRSTHQEDTAVLNVNTPINKATNQCLQIHDTKTNKIPRRNRQIHNYRCRLLSQQLLDQIFQVFAENISKNTELKNTSINMSLSTFIEYSHSTAQYTFFSSSHREHTKLGRILGHQTNLNRFKRKSDKLCSLTILESN